MCCSGMDMILVAMVGCDFDVVESVGGGSRGYAGWLW